MGNKTKRQSKKNPSSDMLESETSFMFPVLHQAVVSAVKDTIDPPQFHYIDDADDVAHEYSTHIMGKFTCTNPGCAARGWGSKKVAILIRSYVGNAYNAVVFNQRCKTCDELGSFKLNESSYVERVTYRLQKWAGVVMEPPAYGPPKGLPHKEELCEGCRKGYCQRVARRSDA